jgi:DHA2 family multidrug resistance protein-like MFS transporter
MTGFYMTSWPLTVALAAPLAGRLSNVVSTAWFCVVGGVLLAIGLTAATLWPPHGDLLPLVISMIVCGLGFGLLRFRTIATCLSPPRASEAVPPGECRVQRD